MINRLILLVEDNADDEKLSVRALKKNSLVHDVVVARDGVEALDFLWGTGVHQGRNTCIQPSVVLLDIKLPKLDGLEVLRRLRTNECTRRTPIVVLSSSKEMHDLMSSYSLGANSYIRKPVDFNEFMEAVRQLGVYWLTLNETPPV